MRICLRKITVMLFLAINVDSVAARENSCPKSYRYLGQFSEREGAKEISLIKGPRALAQSPGVEVFTSSGKAFANRNNALLTLNPTLSIPTPLTSNDELLRLTPQDWELVREQVIQHGNAWISNQEEIAARDSVWLAELEKANLNLKAELEVIDCYIQQASTRQKNPPASTRPGSTPARATAETGAAVQKHTDELSAQYRAAFTQSDRPWDEETPLNNSRKKTVAKQYPQCLQVVDLRQDSTVKTMYWYSIINKCTHALKAHWCDKGDACVNSSDINAAWEIHPGEKTQSWTDVRNNRSKKLNSSGKQFKGTACPLQVNGYTVYYDKKKNQCWYQE